LNILFVHEVDWEHKVVFDIHSLSESLASFGHNIFIIDFVAYDRTKKIEKIVLSRQNLRLKGRARPETWLNIIRPGLIRAPFLDRATAFITHYLAIYDTIRSQKIDAIVLYSVPTNGLQAISLAKKFDIPIVFRSIDILYQLVPSKIFSAPTFFLETYVYKNANRIMALSPKLSDYVVRMKTQRENVELLLFGVDFTRFNPSKDSSSLRRKMGITDKDLVILFIGTLFDFSGLDLYLEQFPQVIKEIPNARLLIVGGGTLLEKLKKRAMALKISQNVIFTGFQPFDLMPFFIGMANVCINPFKLTGATREIIPGKVLQYLACGKPVIATPLPGMTSQIKGEDSGILYFTIEEFASQTIRLLKDRKLTEEIGKNGYEYAKLNHDEIRLARKLEAVLFEEISKKTKAKYVVTHSYS
jgi:glycosyltransferase involved in cell wall biosynthesis